MTTDADAHIQRDEPLTVRGSGRRVDVTRIHTPKGMRLEIRSPYWERRVRLDALALESISWQDEATFPLGVDAPDVELGDDDAFASVSTDELERGDSVQIANEFAQVYATKIRTSQAEGLELESRKLGFDVRLGVAALESIAFQDPDYFSVFLREPYGPEDEH